MSTVRLIPGAGIVSRNARFLNWTADESLDLMMHISKAGDGAFKKLAAAVIAADFSIGPFVVVDFERQAAFVLGNAVLHTPTNDFDGSTTTTWIETALDSCNRLAVNATGGSVSEVSNLVEGTVFASGWAMADFERQSNAPVDISSEAPVEVPEVTRVEVPEIHSAGQVEVDAGPAETGLQTISYNGPEPISYKGPEPTRLGFATQAETKPARVRFDDGQEVEVERGLYVGRYPTKNGLPDSYESVTIHGEHVSRLHWELDLSGDAPIVRDLGSASGLVASADGSEPVAVNANDQFAFEGALRVEFADRWAEIEV